MAANPLGSSLKHIRAVDKGIQGIQGNQLQQFYTSCGIATGAVASDPNKFLVVSIPASPSIAICNE